jgi:tetratricopeptide (TPR) repeat protein
MYLSEFLRVEVENTLEKSLLGRGLKMVRVDAGENKDLPSFFSSQNPGNSVFLVHNLENGFPEAIHYLNFKRETLIGQKVKAVFWVREEELSRITLEAPDFFAFRNRVVEFMDSPAEKEFTPALTAFALETKYRSHTEIERSIALKEKLLSELSTETEISEYLLSSLATLYSTIGAYQKSLDYSEKALKVGLAVFGDKHPNVAAEYNNIGEVWWMLGDVRKAIEYYNKALAVFSDKHPKVAAVYNNIGIAWGDLGDNEKAIKYCSKALEINLAVFGDKHSSVAKNYNNLGLGWSNLGDTRKSIEYVTKALEIVKELYGVDHHLTKTVQENLDTLQRNSQTSKSTTLIG